MAKKEPLTTNSRNKVRVRTSTKIPSFKFKVTLHKGLSINSSKNPWSNVKQLSQMWKQHTQMWNKSFVNCSLYYFQTNRLINKYKPIVFPWKSYVGTENFTSNVPSEEGNGTPLQYSCLENPMDGGAWWAAVHGVAKSRTPLSDFTFTFHFHALEKEMATHSSVLAWRIPGTG